MDNILVIYQGQKKTIAVPITSTTWDPTYTTETEAAFDLTGYDEIWLTIKKRKDSQTETLQVEGTVEGLATAGIVTFEITPAQSELIKAGDYVYDVWISDGTDFQIVVDSILKVMEPVNKSVAV
jgi:hypothetical protein